MSAVETSPKSRLQTATAHLPAFVCYVDLFNSIIADFLKTKFLSQAATRHSCSGVDVSFSFVQGCWVLPYLPIVSPDDGDLD